ncbi:hypothetical protein JOS77_02235 [Chromobacterium haemolyticum]|nr:hypothetical protein JOS77_02235 [Chromobacterium haemolyticum]
MIQLQSGLKRGDEAAPPHRGWPTSDHGGYYDVGSDEGKATLSKAAPHIMDSIDVTKTLMVSCAGLPLSMYCLRRRVLA